MLRNLEGWHVVVLLVVIVLLFGATRLPGVAKSVGQSMKIFRNEMRDVRNDEAKPEDKTGSNGTSGEGSTGDDRSPKA